LVDSEAPEKVRFSVMLVWVEAEELKSCVIIVTQDGHSQRTRGDQDNIVGGEAADELALKSRRVGQWAMSGR
jgi:hypothetical protein